MNAYDIIKQLGLTSNLLDDKQLHIPVGAEVTIRNPEKRKYQDKPPYIQVGIGGKNRMYQAYPFIQTLCVLTKPEQWLILMLIENTNKQTGLSRIPYNTLTATQQVTVRKSYALLKDRDLVRRFKKHDYMINPTAIISPELFQEHLQVWESLAPKPPKTFTYINPKHLPRGFWIKSYKTYNRDTGTYIKP